MSKLKQSNRDREVVRLQKASMALDDLIWQIQGLKIESLKEAANLLRSNINSYQQWGSVGQSYKSSDPNKHFLIGVLPRLFQDKKIFPQNEDIVDFAANALGLEMSRSEKRSRYEIIGKVVVETDMLDEEKLTHLVSALEKLVGNEDRIEQMAIKKREGTFSWNETIQDLLES
ncbi:hypothetical protein [Pseudomonas sp. BN606]|uniref:hypothetical protein n=1 Tax=Pseudomonas sp. BN606 TaxID=2567894 RepID=UPI0024561D78|nr:hypothetical protein [Pseudomonas sp. BN606]MDH4652176.1 hypothetical protein [Pseudomonas sp. BN606]